MLAWAQNIVVYPKSSQAKVKNKELKAIYGDQYVTALILIG
jgi:hypothetical protein